MYATYLSKKGSEYALDKKQEESNQKYSLADKIENVRNVTFTLGILAFIILTLIQLYMPSNTQKEIYQPHSGQKVTDGLIPLPIERPTPKPKGK